MSSPHSSKNPLKLEIRELCNETRPIPEIPFSFPTLNDELLEKSQPQEKISILTDYLNQQKQSYKQYKKLEQKCLEKDHKKEMFLLKYNTVINSKYNIFY